MADERNKDRDANHYAESIEGAFGGLQVSIDMMKDRLAEPILRLEHIVEFMRFSDRERLVDDLTECARHLRSTLYICYQLANESATRSLDECRECADDLHARWGVAAFEAHTAEENLRRVRPRLDFLESQRDARLQEHSPSSPDLRARVLSLTGGKCAYCETEITADPTDGNANFVIEHVVPKSCGGPDHFSNYVPACSKCNAQKAAGHVLEFIQRKLVVNRVEIAEAAE